jgi:uncharacterized membrane protein YhaH (DUF805 family)
MSFALAIKTCFSKYVNFSDRASRPEYWWWQLFVLIGVFGLAMLSAATTSPSTTPDESTSGSDAVAGLLVVFILAVLLPSVAVAVRRLHDQSKSGAWLFISFIPYVGGIWMLVLMASKGTPGPNNYGPTPGEAAAIATYSGGSPMLPPPPMPHSDAMWK